MAVMLLMVSDHDPLGNHCRSLVPLPISLQWDDFSSFLLCPEIYIYQINPALLFP